MKIRYTITRYELFKARIVMALSNRSLLAFLAVAGIFVAYMTLTAKAYASYSLSFKLLLTAITLLFVYGGSVIGLLFTSFIQSFTGQQKGLIGEHTLSITDDGLEERTPYNVSLHRWAAFGKRKKRSGFWFIYVTDGMAHIISTRRPLLEGDLPEFIRAIEEKIRLHR